MVFPLIFGVVALASAIGTGTYYGLANQEPDQIITNNKTYQNDYISNITTYDFSSSFFENGSNISLTNTNNTTTKKSAKTTSEQTAGESPIKNILIISGMIAGGIFIYGGVKK